MTATRYVYRNRRDYYDIIDTATDEKVGHEPDHTSAYFATHTLNVVEWKKAPAHHISTGTRTLGGSPIRGGGTFRCSEAHCSCGWSATCNGQTYAESVQEIREHLKEMGVYTTQLEQTVYAHVAAGNMVYTQEKVYYFMAQAIAERSGKTLGRVKKVLAKLIESGHVEEFEAGKYRRTDKWFSWND